MRYIGFDCHYIQMLVIDAFVPITIHSGQELMKDSAMCYFNWADIGIKVIYMILSINRYSN